MHDSAVIAAGYTDHPAPASAQYHDGYYAAYALDPDGTNVELVNHRRG
jgi:lactoylglutathione lyase